MISVTCFAGLNLTTKVNVEMDDFWSVSYVNQIHVMWCDAPWTNLLITVTGSGTQGFFFSNVPKAEFVLFGN